MYKTLDEALLKITEMQQQLETEQQISTNLKNELNVSRETLQQKENEITRLQGINQQFFLKLTNQDNNSKTLQQEKPKPQVDNTLSMSDLIKRILK